ncbi:putative oxidoreductase [Medicago truncatula]|uniref:Putative oxidoreductase n=1 Tax=Medicago truncatula TaxID=3880 RepID=A0A396GLW4_MEDTR|nr:putative oxidoreductase [Medicago truncatula]
MRNSTWTDQMLGLKGVTILKNGCALEEGLCICSQDSHCNPSKGLCIWVHLVGSIEVLVYDGSIFSTIGLDYPSKSYHAPSTLNPTQHSLLPLSISFIAELLAIDS